MFQSKKIVLNRWKDEFFTLLLFLICLMLLIFFPSQNHIGQTLIGFVFILFVLPWLFSRLVIKQPLKNLGWKTISWSKNKLWIAGFLISSVIIGLLIVQIPFIRENYLINTTVARYFWAFLFYELVIFNLLAFLETSFFQGFLLMIFKNKLKRWSLVVSFILFLIYIFSFVGFQWSLTPFIVIMGITSLLSYRAESFFWSYVAILISDILINASFIRAIH